MSDFIPYGCFTLDEDDKASIAQVLTGDWLSGGPYVEQFEHSLKDTLNSPYVYSVANGTAALHLAFLSLGLGPGDFVLVPTVTFLASANAARYVGADIIFVDVDEETGLMTAETLAEAISDNEHKNIRAVVNVHLQGQCADLESIYNVAKAHDLFIIEDAAHALGTSYVTNNGKQYAVGQNQFSDMTTFSFHAVKTITTGEGGAISCQNIDLANKIELYRNHGMTRNDSLWKEDSLAFDEKRDANPWYYEMHSLGFNYRLSDLNCALGISQLKKLSQFKARRSELVEHYDEAFKDIEHVKLTPRYDHADTCWHLYVLRVDFSQLQISRAAVMNQLKSQQIGTQVHYIPVHCQPYYQSLYGAWSLPGAMQYYQQTLSLPLHIGLSDALQQHIIQHFIASIRK